jgi:hypothetical protein
MMFLAYFLGKFFDSLADDVNIFLSEFQSTDHFFFGDFTSTGFDHTYATFGSGNYQI